MIKTNVTCSEPKSHIENYSKINDGQKWEIHHRLETHRYNKKTGRWEEREEALPREALMAAGLYENVPAWQLIYMTVSEHRALTGRLRDSETRKKMSEKVKGKNNHFYGKKHTDETKMKMRKPHPTSQHLFECIETGEIKSGSDWSSLGYTHAQEVADGIRKVNKGKTFRRVK